MKAIKPAWFLLLTALAIVLWTYPLLEVVVRLALRKEAWLAYFFLSWLLLIIALYVLAGKKN